MSDQNGTGGTAGTAPGTPSTPGQGGAKAKPSAFDLMYAALHGTAYFRIHGIGKSTVWAYARENPDHPLWVTYLDRGVPGVAALVAEMQRIALEEASANDPLYATPAPSPAAEVDAVDRILRLIETEDFGPEYRRRTADRVALFDAIWQEHDRRPRADGYSERDSFYNGFLVGWAQGEKSLRQSLAALARATRTEGGRQG